MDQKPTPCMIAEVVQSRRKDAIATVLSCLAGLVVLTAFVAWRYGSVEAAVASAKGRSLLPDATIKSLGDVPANQTANFSYTLRNLTGHPIQLQRSQTSCSCSVVAGLPCSIEPRSTKTISVVVSIGSKPGALEGSFHLYTADSSQPDIQLGYTGRVVSPNADAGR